MNETGSKTLQELYALLGEFTVEFEKVCYFLRETIVFWSFLADNKDESFVKNLTAEMGANSLVKSFRSIAVKTENLTPEELKIIASICNQINSLISERNELLHATWFGSSVSTSDESVGFIRGEKLTHTANGVIEKPLNLSPEKFEPLIYKCKYMIYMLTMCALAMKTGFMEANFTFDENGVAVLKNLPYGDPLDNLNAKEPAKTNP